MRDGCHLRLETACEKVLWSEASPLPGFSVESSAQVAQELARITPFLLGQIWVAGTFIGKIRALTHSPSLQFALISALDLFFYPEELLPVPIQALLTGSVTEILNRAKSAKDEGIQTAKLKIGGLKKEEIGPLLAEITPHFRLRIDANRMWRSEELAEIFVAYLSKIDYTEELLIPGIPQAIDESLRDGSQNSAIWIVKPTLGMAPLFVEERPRTILSSSYESEIGLFHIARLRQRLKISDPAGIDTYRFLSGTILPLRAKKGYLIFPDANKMSQLADEYHTLHSSLSY